MIASEPLTKIGTTVITCPFCSLLCDDIQIATDNAGMIQVPNACPRSKALFARFDSSLQISDVTSGESRQNDLLTGKLQQAATLLVDSEMPLFTGLATDVAGQRSAYSLAHQLSAVIDHASSHVMMRDLQVMQFRGGYYGTLSEIKSRAEEIIIVGAGPIRQLPRLLNRIDSKNPPGLTLDTNRNPAPRPRHITLVLPWHQSPFSPNSVYTKEQLGLEETTSPNRELHTVEDLSTWAKSLAGHCANPTTIAPQNPNIISLVERIRSANYSAIIWSAEDFHDIDGDLTIDRMMDAIVELNTQTHVIGMATSGEQCEPTSAAVMTWLAGFPTRFQIATDPAAGRETIYDPYRYDSERLIQDGIADVGLWISTLDPAFGPPDSGPYSRIRWIGVGPQDAQWKSRCELFFDVGTPGVDHASILFRADNAVSIPIQPVRPSQQLSAAELMKQLNDIVKQRQGISLASAGAAENH